MKKLSYILLLIVLCFGMCIGFTACGENEPETVSYTITFKEEGFDDVKRTIEQGKDLPDTEIPVIQGSKVGYTITWEDVDLKNITEDKTVNAVYTPNTYTITINNNGGSGITSLSVTFDTPYALTIPTRTGWTFTGWKVGNQDFATTGTWTTASDITIKATWRENDNIVLFKGLDKANFSNTWAHFNDLRNVDGGIELEIKSNVEFVDPTDYIVKSGFEFICFVDDDNKVVELGTTRNGDTFIESDATVNAYFAEVKTGKQIVAFLEKGYVPNVKYVDNGGALTDIPNVQEARPGYNLTWNVTDFTNISETVRVSTVATEKIFRIFYYYDKTKISEEKISEFGLKYDETTQSWYQEVRYLAQYRLLDEIVDVSKKLVEEDQANQKSGWREINSDANFYSADSFTLTEDIVLVANEVDKDRDDMTNDDNWSPAQ